MLKLSAELKKDESRHLSSKMTSFSTKMVQNIFVNYRFSDKGRTIVPDVTCLPLSPRLRSYDAGTFWKQWKIRRIGPPFTRKRHIFCRQLLETVGFEDVTLTGTFWKLHRVNTWKWRKQNIFSRFWNETDRFLRCRYTSLASKPCSEFCRIIFYRLQIVPASCES